MYITINLKKKEIIFYLLKDKVFQLKIISNKRNSLQIENQR